MMITQTWMGRLLCFMGFHLLVYAQGRNNPDGFAGSLSGGCVRCNRSFGWDF